MKGINIKTILDRQRKYFASHATKEIDFRLKQLKKLREALRASEDKIALALYKDLHKSKAQAYLTETGICLQEITHIINNLKAWAKPQNAAWPVLFPFSKNYIRREPFGVVLVVSPWNYPFFLSLLPLMGALAAGNCVILKPSRHSPGSALALDEIISGCFGEEYVKVLQLAPGSKTDILKEKFDYIFFTGGEDTGKKILSAAAKHITPVTLELGGKCPCIVDSDIDLEKTAKRIVFGKFLNAGQTCVAPDYILAEKGIKDRLVQKIKQNIARMYGDNPQKSADYGRIINNGQFDRIAGYLDCGDIAAGGKMDRRTGYMEPVLLENVPPGSRVMRDEIFGPVLPVIAYTGLEEAIDFVNKRQKPLVLYYFSRDKKKQEKVLNETSSGSACVNDTVIQLSSKELPFGGTGNSGFGRYRGKSSFDTFSNVKSVLKQTNLFDLNLRYPPVAKWAMKLLKLFLKG